MLSFAPKPYHKQCPQLRVKSGTGISGMLGNNYDRSHPSSRRFNPALL